MRIETTKRYDEIAIWLVHEGERHNVWDLKPKEVTEDVLVALERAVEVACKLQKLSILKKIEGSLS